MTERTALQDVVKAWEALPEGYHRAQHVDQWLRNHMKPAIDRARAALAEKDKADD